MTVTTTPTNIGPKWYTYIQKPSRLK